MWLALGVVSVSLFRSRCVQINRQAEQPGNRGRLSPWERIISSLCRPWYHRYSNKTALLTQKRKPCPNNTVARRTTIFTSLPAARYVGMHPNLYEAYLSLSSCCSWARHLPGVKTPTQKQLWQQPKQKKRRQELKVRSNRGSVGWK